MQGDHDDRRESVDLELLRRELRSRLARQRRLGVSAPPPALGRPLEFDESGFPIDPPKTRFADRLRLLLSA